MAEHRSYASSDSSANPWLCWPSIPAICQLLRLTSPKGRFPWGFFFVVEGLPIGIASDFGAFHIDIAGEFPVGLPGRHTPSISIPGLALALAPSLTVP